MTDVLLEIALWFIGVALLTVAVWRGFRRRETPHPAPRRNYDTLAPLAPLYGAQRLPTRPVPPVVVPDRAAHDALVAGIWAPNPMKDTVIVAHPLWWDAT